MAGPGLRGRAQLLVAVGIVLALSLQLARSYPLIDPDEGRNAEVAREMFASGEFIVPHLAGMPYLDKPPALFWAQTAAFHVFGVTPFAARVPAAAAAALILWCVGALALRVAGTHRMWLAVGLTACAPLFFGLSAYVIFDMLLAACVAVVWVLSAREAEESGSMGVGSRVLLFLALALGVLTKGPVMLAWGLGGSVFAALLVRSLAPLRWVAWWPGWIVFFALAGGWFALATMRHPEYPQYAFVDETFRRMTTGAFKREQPWWFVPAVLAGGALPWSLATPWRFRLSPSAKVALGFIVFAAVFFTVSRSKLVTYLLPAIPCMAWIAAEAWEHGWRSRRAAIGMALTLAIVTAGAIVFGWYRAAWGTIIEPHVIDQGMRSARIVAFVLGAGTFMAAIGARQRHSSWAFVAAQLFLPAVLLPVWPTLSEHARTQSGAPLAEAIRAEAPDAVIRYEHAYSPGTDFLLGHGSRLVSDLGYETTSNYQIHYRETLMNRGQWRPEPFAAQGDVDVVVRRTDTEIAPLGPFWEPFFADRRFTAYRRRGPSR